MRDGIFRLQYTTATLSATAAVMLSGGAISGADRHYFMYGHCERHGNRLKGLVTLTRHTPRQGPGHAIPDQFDVVIDGLCGDDFGQFDLHCPEVPLVKGKGQFTWMGSPG